MSIYRAYKRWALENGLKPMGSGNLWEDLQSLHPQLDKRRSSDPKKRMTTLFGAGLTPEAAAAPTSGTA